MDWIRNSTMDHLIAKIDRAEQQGGMIPVYYFEVGRNGTKLYYFSGAAAGRVRQVRKWAEIMGEHSPCDSLKCLCPACALFGTTTGGGIKGHLRVTDARAETATVKPVTHTLPILGEPRPSSFEFYLRRPEAAETPMYWNYDYFGVREKIQTKKGIIERTLYRDLKSATPRGRKFYWHGQTMPDYEKCRMNQTMEAVPAGTSFTFRIYFDRVSEEQLDDLKWLICLGENQKDGKYQYKLGHAKPLGYSSAKMVVKECVTRILCEDITMLIEPIKNPECSKCSFDMESETIQSILRMSDCTAIQGYRVAYPTGVDNTGREQIYSWFQHNRASAGSLLTLPEPWESDLALPTKRRTRDGYSQGQRGPRVNGGDTPQVPGALVGQEVEGTVRRVFPNGNTFIRLKGSRMDGFYRQQHYERIMEGDVLKVRILSYDADRENYRVRPI